MALTIHPLTAKVDQTRNDFLIARRGSIRGRVGGSAKGTGGREARTRGEKAEGGSKMSWEEKGRRSIFPAVAARAALAAPAPSFQRTLELQLTMLITRTAPVKTLATRT